MSNFRRKFKRTVAQAEGLPRGFYCSTMQNKMAAMDRQISKLNQLIEAQKEDLALATGLSDALETLNKELASEEQSPNGTEN